MHLGIVKAQSECGENKRKMKMEKQAVAKMITHGKKSEFYSESKRSEEVMARKFGSTIWKQRL